MIGMIGCLGLGFQSPYQNEELSYSPCRRRMQNTFFSRGNQKWEDLFIYIF